MIIAHALFVMQIIGFSIYQWPCGNNAIIQILFHLANFHTLLQQKPLYYVIEEFPTTLVVMTFLSKRFPDDLFAIHNFRFEKNFELEEKV